MRTNKQNQRNYKGSGNCITKLDFPCLTTLQEKEQLAAEKSYISTELGNYREKATEAHRTVASLGEQTRSLDHQVLSLKGRTYLLFYSRFTVLASIKRPCSNYNKAHFKIQTQKISKMLRSEHQSWKRS